LKDKTGRQILIVFGHCIRCTKCTSVPASNPVYLKAIHELKPRNKMSKIFRMMSIGVSPQFSIMPILSGLCKSTHIAQLYRKLPSVYPSGRTCIAISPIDEQPTAHWA